MSFLRSVSIRVKGKVQGVWYRASAKTVADSLNLTGFVSNMTDGSVYIEVSGSASDISLFITWCNEGPELARVDSIVVSEIDLRPHAAFEIRRFQN